MPSHLEELSIKSCKMTINGSQELLRSLSTRCYLQKLEISKCPGCFKGDNLTMIMELIEKSVYIKEIALSDIGVLPNKMQELLEVISYNRTLKSIDISNNVLIPLYRKEGDYELDYYEEQTISNLVRLFKYSMKLQHINLANTGLTKNVINGIIRNIKNSRSI